MATEHYCPEHPDGKGWYEGHVTGCPYHKHNRNAPRVRMSGKDRAKADKRAGEIGQDRGGYING